MTMLIKKVFPKKYKSEFPGWLSTKEYRKLTMPDKNNANMNVENFDKKKNIIITVNKYIDIIEYKKEAR